MIRLVRVRTLCLSILLLLFVFPCASFAGIIYVSEHGSDANDGLSWATAKQTVQAGLDASLSGDEVWVAAGSYVETITLKEGVGLYGGFAGTETTRDERDWAVNVTTLDGSSQGSVVTSPAAAAASTIIDGFTIRYGYAEYGGGIYCGCCSPTISNNTIIANYASAAGSGIYCVDGSPTIVNNIIRSNGWQVDACDGGGIAYIDSTPIIANNTITMNNAGFGGAIFCLDPLVSTGEPAIGNLVASLDGCVQSLLESTTICNNTIVWNTASLGGGGICCWEGSFPTIANNIVAGNSSGILNEGGAPVLRNNCVYANTDYNYSGLSPGTGDISSNPLFVNPSTGDYHLLPVSLCINAGWNDAPNLPLFDMDGEGRVFGGTADIGADEFWSSTMSVPDAKRAPDGAAISGDGAIVSEAFPDFFYIEADDRSSGIRVEKAGHALTEGVRADVAGSVQTNPDGERYIVADSATPSGTGAVSPIALGNKSLGGGDWFYNPATGAGQKGIAGGCGLNNIGLLIRAWGKVTDAGANHFYLDDGSALDDGSGYLGVKVLAEGLSIPGEGACVTVTGISSCFKDGNDLHRLVRVRDQADIGVIE